MFTRSSILVPTDFSEHAERALQYAFAFAKQFEGTLHFAHVVDATMLTGVRGDDMSLGGAGVVELLQTMQDYSEGKLAELMDRASREGISASKHLVVGNPTTELLRLIDSTGSTLVILATHGRSGFQRFVFGSVAERIVRESAVPVLSVKQREHDFVAAGSKLAIKRVLYPTDFSDFSKKALPFAESLARQFGATLVLFHATEVPVMLPDALPEAAMQLGPQLEAEAKTLIDNMRQGIPGINVEAEVRIGPAASEISAFAQSTEVDVIVVPTHGRSGLSRMLFGSVAEKVVRLAKCPVLTIRPEYESSR